jgi:hypothetical protein
MRGWILALALMASGAAWAQAPAPNWQAIRDDRPRFYRTLGVHMAAAQIHEICAGSAAPALGTRLTLFALRQEWANLQQAATALRDSVHWLASAQEQRRDTTRELLTMQPDAACARADRILATSRDLLGLNN